MIWLAGFFFKYIKKLFYLVFSFKNRNIFVTVDDKKLIAKIGDFGRSIQLPEGKNTIEQDAQLGGILPLKWMPPESIKSKEFSFASDGKEYFFFSIHLFFEYFFKSLVLWLLFI